MKLDGIHHITAITADAPRNVDFYARLLGLRLVKKTVNFDRPDVYHLYYGDEAGHPGSILTFFEFPGAPLGRHGDGMIHRVTWRVASEEALAFWAERLASEAVEPERDGPTLRFADPEGLGLELAVTQSADPPLVARADDIPAEHALLGFEGVRAYADAPELSAGLLEGQLGFTGAEHGHIAYRVDGAQRGALYAYDPPPEQPGRQGAGSVHHIAWAAQDEDHESWRERVAAAGEQVTPIIDRTYFRSIYFQEPSGVLFEIATLGPGFAVDEPAQTLGSSLQLPPQHEHLRARLEQSLTPLASPREQPVG